nr:uncharacterized protein LOC129384008 [Dermacentor andersoni]
MKGIYVLEGKWSLEFMNTSTLRLATSAFAMAATFVTLLLVFLGRLRRTLPPSGLCCALYGALTVAALVDMVRFLERIHNAEVKCFAVYRAFRRSLCYSSILYC